VFGRRPDGNPACLLRARSLRNLSSIFYSLHRPTQLKRTFPGLNGCVLPDGQAGCWAFRLSVGPRLQLTASGYEIEFDLLASTLDAGLKACFSEPS